MKKTFILIFLLLMVSVNAQEFNNYDTLKINTDLSSSLLLTRSSFSSKVGYAYANLTFLPENSEMQQTNYSITTDPGASKTIGKDYIYFKWESPRENVLKFEVNSQENTKVNFKHIKEKINFPIRDNLDEFQEYLINTETVTSQDPQIIKKANELAQGEDDLFVVVHKIGAWTKQNINYSLETLTADVSQNASWVLENKIGVCDELTSLFVAMLRSINIPARFVTGQSYTNLINGFGNHAWAEVYFPRYGWIPFDPTYGQLGYIDSTHIKMKTGNDVKDSDVNYGWLSNDVDVETSGLDIKSQFISYGDIHKENISLNMDLLKKDPGPGSYIPIKVNIKNTNDYYLPLSVYIYKAPIKVNDYVRDILLKPNEEKSIFFIIQTPKNLERGFLYSSEIGIKDNFNNNITKSLQFTPDGDKVTLEEAQILINQLKKEDEKIYSKNVELTCTLDKDYYYDYESGKINCDITNKGNVNLNSLNVCYKKECKQINLNIVEKKFLSFKFSPQDKEFLVTVSNEDVSKFSIVNPSILSIPNLTINVLNYPREAKYFDDLLLRFNINTNSEIRNLKLRLNNKEIYNSDKFLNNENFEINLKGHNLREENTITASYQDKNNNLYIKEEKFNSKVEKPFYIKYLWLIILLILIYIANMIFQRKRRMLHSYYN